MTEQSKKNVEHGGGLEGIIFIAGFLSIIFTPLILAYQAYVWLRKGEWPSIPLSDVFVHFGYSLPTSDWGGIQKIIDWLMDCPSSACFFVVGIGLFFLGIKFMESQHR